MHTLGITGATASWGRDVVSECTLQSRLELRLLTGGQRLREPLRSCTTG